MNKQIKLIILQTHPIQYWTPLYRSLSEIENLTVDVIYLTDAGVKPYYDPGFGSEITWDVPLLEGYESSVLRAGEDITELGFWSRHHQSLPDLLFQSKPDWILVDGYSSRMNWEALFWGIRHRAKIAYTSDSNCQIRRSLLKSAAKQLPVRFFFSQVSAFFSPSLSNQHYLLQYGADPARIHRYPYPIDYERFHCESRNPKEYDFIWAGKLTARKKPLDFVNALVALKNRGHKGFRAAIVGDGELMQAVQKQASELINAGIIKCHGFVNYSQMPAELGKANTFVFTSDNEPYGLVATEAAATGAALIVAEGIGCVGPDSSAQPGVNTLTYPTGNIEALTDAMEQVLTDHVLRSRMQEQSQNISQQHSVSKAALIIVSAITSV